jgi:glucose/arabinose dehydrogenase
MPQRFAILRILLLAAALVQVSCGEDDKLVDTNPPPEPADTYTAQWLLDAAAPVYVTAPAGESRIWVSRQVGIILLVEKDGSRQQFMDIRDRVNGPDGQGGYGVTAMAFHPNYESNGYFFVLYVASPSGDVVLSRFSRSAANPDRGDPSSEEIFFSWPRIAGAIHHSADIRFHPQSGYLYVSLGDGTASSLGGSEKALDLGEMAGKVLRIDVDMADLLRGKPYSIPADNPFVNTPGALPEIWSRGFRNPWRFSFDPLTHDMLIPDVGNGSWEEVNIEPANDPGGRSYGWNRLEGSHCSPVYPGCDPADVAAQYGITLPVHEYSHDPPPGALCSGAIIGGLVYRGSAIPELYGRYIFADYCFGQIWVADYTPGTGIANVRDITSVLTGDSLQFNLSSFGEDADGEMYLCDRSAHAVYRIMHRDSLQGE